jgi:hypothetical protein
MLLIYGVALLQIFTLLGVAICLDRIYHLKKGLDTVTTFINLCQQELEEIANESST